MTIIPLAKISPKHAGNIHGLAGKFTSAIPVGVHKGVDTRIRAHLLVEAQAVQLSVAEMAPGTKAGADASKLVWGRPKIIALSEFFWVEPEPDPAPPPAAAKK